MSLEEIMSIETKIEEHLPKMFVGCWLMSVIAVVVGMIFSLAVSGGVIIALYYLIKYLIKINAGA